MNRSDLTHRQQIFIDDAFVVRCKKIIHLLQALADDLTSKNEKIRELQDALKQCSADNAAQDVTPTHSPSTFKVSYNGGFLVDRILTTYILSYKQTIFLLFPLTNGASESW